MSNGYLQCNLYFYFCICSPPLFSLSYVLLYLDFLPTTLQIMKRVEAILYASTAEEGRQILMDTQQEFAGRVFLEEDEAAAQVRMGG